jgi:hypothetical protein
MRRGSVLKLFSTFWGERKARGDYLPWGESSQTHRLSQQILGSCSPESISRWPAWPNMWITQAQMGSFSSTASTSRISMEQQHTGTPLCRRKVAGLQHRAVGRLQVNYCSRRGLRLLCRWDTRLCGARCAFSSGATVKMMSTVSGKKIRICFIEFSQTFLGWLAVEFRSCAGIPPSVRNDQRRGRRQMWPDVGGSICCSPLSAACSG